METLTLENLGKGAAEEEFQEALKVVLANIRDPNTAGNSSGQSS